MRQTSSYELSAAPGPIRAETAGAMLSAQAEPPGVMPSAQAETPGAVPSAQAETPGVMPSAQAETPGVIPPERSVSEAKPAVRRQLRIPVFCLALLLVLSGFGLVSGIAPAFAAGKVKLNHTRLSMETGTAARLRVKNAARTVKWTSSDRTIIRIGKKTGKHKQSVILKSGSTAGTCWVKAKVGKKTMKCKVMVTAAGPRVLPLSTDAVDLAADLPYQTADAEDTTEGTDAFDLAYKDFSIRLLQEILKQETTSSEGGSCSGPAPAGTAGNSDLSGRSGKQPGNVLISPDSVMTALTMTANGAGSSTLTAMEETLLGGRSIGAPQNSSLPAAAASQQAARSETASDGSLPAAAASQQAARSETASDGSLPAAGLADADGTAATADPDLAALNQNLRAMHVRLTGSGDLIYQSSNSIWARRGKLKPAPAFLQVNKACHDAAFYEAAFDPQTCEDMNRWVYNKTRNMIDQIIDPSRGFDEDARMVLLNAVAFEGSWIEDLYELTETADRQFTTADGRQQTVNMLAGHDAAYLELAGGTGFSYNYRGGSMAFLGLLPPKGMGAADYAASLTGDALQTAWENRSHPRGGVVFRLPAFSYDYAASVKDALKAMGMEIAFSDYADFSGIPDPAFPALREDLKIDDVLHKTHIELDKHGTKAAAVTAVIIAKSTSILPTEPPRQVFLDRPFVYAILDTKTGNPLFLGTVEDPAAGR